MKHVLRFSGSSSSAEEPTESPSPQRELSSTRQRSEAPGAERSSRPTRGRGRCFVRNMRVITAVIRTYAERNGDDQLLVQEFEKRGYF